MTVQEQKRMMKLFMELEWKKAPNGFRYDSGGIILFIGFEIINDQHTNLVELSIDDGEKKWRIAEFSGGLLYNLMDRLFEKFEDGRIGFDYVGREDKYARLFNLLEKSQR